MSKGKRKTYGSHFSQYATPKPEPKYDDMETLDSFINVNVGTVGHVDHAIKGMSISSVIFDELNESIERFKGGLGIVRKAYQEQAEEAQARQAKREKAYQDKDWGGFA